MKKVFSLTTRRWVEVIEETDEYYMAKDIDGWTLIVVKDGTESVIQDDEG